MADVFISYASDDRDYAQRLAVCLGELGHSVWWDRDLVPGSQFDVVIERELKRAMAVIVIWSSHSVDSRWVKSEASEAAHHDKLIPILIEDIRPPLEFRRIQTADFTNWDGSMQSPSFQSLVRSVEGLKAAFGPSFQSQSKPPSSRPAAPETTRAPFSAADPTKKNSGIARAIYIVWIIVVFLGFAVVDFETTDIRVVDVIGLILTVGPLIAAYLVKDSSPAWVKDHFIFQIRTFWISLLFFFVIFIAAMFAVLDQGMDPESPEANAIVVGLPMLVVSIWQMVRYIRGLMSLSKGHSVPHLRSWLW